MEVKITKKQMKKMIISYYEQLGATDLDVHVYSEKEHLSLLQRNYNDDGTYNKNYYVDNTVIVTGSIESDGFNHRFSEEVEMSQIEEIVKANFDEKKYNIQKIEFENGIRPSLFSSSIFAPYCKGLLITMDQNKKIKGKYIVKK